jgi:hypothetical protein
MKRTDEQHRALQLLASSVNGYAEALLLAHGFESEMLGKLVLDGLAQVEARNMMGGAMKVRWMTITEAGGARRSRNSTSRAFRGAPGCKRLQASFRVSNERFEFRFDTRVLYPSENRAQPQRPMTEPCLLVLEFSRHLREPVRPPAELKDTFSTDRYLKKKPRRSGAREGRRLERPDEVQRDVSTAGGADRFQDVVQQDDVAHNNGDMRAAILRGRGITPDHVRRQARGRNPSSIPQCAGLSLP